MDHLSELAGLSVGYEHGAVGELMITEALDRAGLERNQIESLDLALDEHLDAWRDGVVDVLVTYEPVAGLLLNQGAVNIFDSTEMPEIIIDVLAVRADRIGAGESAALEHLVATHLRTLDYFKHNPQDSSYRMAERLELPAGEVLPAYHGLVLPDLTNNYRLLQGDHSALADHLKRRLDFKAHPAAADGRARLDDLFSARFLPPPASP